MVVLLFGALACAPCQVSTSSARLHAIADDSSPGSGRLKTGQIPELRGETANNVAGGNGNDGDGVRAWH